MAPDWPQSLVIVCPVTKEWKWNNPDHNMLLKFIRPKQSSDLQKTKLFFIQLALKLRAALLVYVMLVYVCVYRWSVFALFILTPLWCVVGGKSTNNLTLKTTSIFSPASLRRHHSFKSKTESDTNKSPALKGSFCVLSAFVDFFYFTLIFISILWNDFLFQTM